MAAACAQDHLTGSNTARTSGRSGAAHQHSPWMGFKGTPQRHGRHVQDEWLMLISFLATHQPQGPKDKCHRLHEKSLYSPSTAASWACAFQGSLHLLLQVTGNQFLISAIHYYLFQMVFSQVKSMVHHLSLILASYLWGVQTAMLNIVNKKILNSDSVPQNIQINSTRFCTMNVCKAQQDRNTKSRVPFLADLRNEEKASDQAHKLL